MRVLWVKMGGLLPATTGGRVRSLNTISQLARRHEVTVITTHGEGDDPDGLKQQFTNCAQVVSVPFMVPKRGSLSFSAAVIGSWFSQYPVDLWKWRVSGVRRLVSSVIAGGGIDLCVADFLFAAVNVPMPGPVPVVLFAHNVEYMIWQRLASLETSPWKRALFEMEWRKLRAREIAVCRRANLTIAVSQDDRDRLQALDSRIQATDISTGVDTTYFTPSHHKEVPDRLVFSGSMDWHPNEDAVCHFVDHVLPRIQQERPHVSFVIVGRNPSERVRALTTRPGVEVTGTVDDVRPAIGQASVYVVPLRAGGGTRIKIFEALAMGKALVSTTVGAEGLAVEPGRHFVAADGADEFARAVLGLLSAPEARRALGAAGRALVEEKHSWTTVARQFEERCEEVVAAHVEHERPTDRRADLSRAGSPRYRGTGLVAREHAAVGWPDRHS